MGIWVGIWIKINMGEEGSVRRVGRICGQMDLVFLD